MPGAAGVESLENMLGAVNANHGYPALVAAVCSKDGLIASGAVGVRKAGESDPVTPDDRFHIGSITKPITATLCAMLVEDGLLAWDAAPTDILPEFASGLHPSLRDVRLEHLLAHRAGIAPFTDDAELEPVPAFDGSPRDQRLAFTGWLLRQPPVVTPVSTFSYSNAGYAIVAAMVERVARQSWDVLLRDRLFGPLALGSAGFGWPAKGDPAQPWGHFKRGAALEPQAPDGEYQLDPRLAPAGDVHMSVVDLAAFGRMHLRGLAGDDTLLKPDTVRRMHTPLGADIEEGYGSGLGWGISERSSSYAGCAGTFFAVIMVRLQHDRVYALATNAAATTVIDPAEDDMSLCNALVEALIKRFET